MKEARPGNFVKVLPVCWFRICVIWVHVCSWLPSICTGSRVSGSDWATASSTLYSTMVLLSCQFWCLEILSSSLILGFNGMEKKKTNQVKSYEGYPNRLSAMPRRLSFSMISVWIFNLKISLPIILGLQLWPVTSEHWLYNLWLLEVFHYV